MWDAPPPDTARDLAGDGQEVLTPAAMEAVLADFRSWLQHLSSALKAPCPSPEAAQEQAVDLHTLLGQFLAVRHEVNLQTKAARSGQEQTGLALQQFSQALEAVRLAQAAAQQTNQQAQDEALRPLLKTLLDVHDALSLAEREIGRARGGMLPFLDELASERVAPDNGSCNTEPQAVPLLAPEGGLRPDDQQRPGSKRSVWHKWFGRRNQSDASEQTRALVAQRERYQRLLKHQNEQRHQAIAQAAERLDQLLDSVVAGYRMSLQRLERTLQQSGLEPIPCVGERFDPEQMEVVAAVADSGRPAGEVIEEVRRGYRWHGRVFRYAQVSVAKGSS